MGNGPALTWDASCVGWKKVKLPLPTGDHPLSTRIVHNYQALCTFLASEQIGGKRLIISSSSAGPACENSLRMSPSLLAIGSAALSILPGTSHAPRAPSTLTRKGLFLLGWPRGGRVIGQGWAQGCRQPHGKLFP